METDRLFTFDRIYPVTISRMIVPLVVASALISSRGAAQGPPSQENPTIHGIVADVSADRIEADIRKLVGFGTRNTMSDTLSSTRGIGAARRWIKSQFDSISGTCGNCLEVFYLEEVFPAGGRIVAPTNIVNVVAIQRGTSDPNRMVMMAGDIDDRISNASNFVDSAPGANDNASGMAGTIEAARVLSQHRFEASIVYLGLSGEEQGLFGGGTVARHARAEGWNIVGVLNNDMIGNIQGISGVTENTTARVFSDPTPVDERLLEQIDNALDRARTQAAAGQLDSLDRTLSRVRALSETQWQLFRRAGGEVDGSARQLGRYVDRMADLYLPTLDIMMIYRLDRFGRGGHHTPFSNLGYPGVRIMESNENYNRQHQDIRVENGIAYGDVLEGVNFVYAAKLTALNASTLASLAWAPGPPEAVSISGAVRPAATMRWSAPGDAQNVAGYRVYWRATDSPTWDYSRWVGSDTEFRFEGLVIDNYYFGVAAVADDGSESTVVFPLPRPRSR
jgi:hypothetical protein